MLNKFKAAVAAGALAMGTLLGSVAGAATLSGTFDVIAVNVTNLTGAQSRATEANFLSALELAGSLGGAFADLDSSAEFDVFTYDGAIDFRIGGPQKATYSISDWLATGTGSVTGLDPLLGAAQLSFPSISAGTATTTFFFFSLLVPDLDMSRVTGFDVTHDDGVRFFEGVFDIGGVNGPTGERNTTIQGYGGGSLGILYVATNGNPSILEVDTIPAIPLPAGAWLLIGGVGALGALRRRKSA